MALHTEIRVSIDGQILPVVDSFSLKEDVGNHAAFQIAIEGEHLTSGSDNSSAILEKSKAYLGKSCLVEITRADTSSSNETLEFKGIVTNLEAYRDSNDGETREMVLISGNSGSIILDGGTDMNSFLDETLSNIVINAVGSYNQALLNVSIAPENDPTIAYSVQQNQTKFGYLQYLAAKQGEYLIYAQDTLYFGKPDLGEPISLNLGSTLENISLGIKTLPTNFNYFSNDYLNETSATSATADATPTNNAGFVSFATSVNEDLYPDPTQLGFNSYEDLELQQRLDNSVALQKKVLEQAQVALTGTSFLPSVSLGKVVRIENNGTTYGDYRVISIKHSCSDSGKYKNTFTAVPMEVDIYPLTNINNSLKSGTQIAKVFSNVDPEGLSRVQVQFPWQVATNQTTPWIRVMTPHSGADKGFHFIPEVEEEVIIGFEGSDAERPYVMCALYTGINKPEEWQTDANNVKAIRTRSGHTIELNDTEGEEKINIYDNEGSIITFDTQEKSLIINATENIKMVAKNIILEAQENIDIGAQKNVDIAAKGNLSNLAKGNLALQSSRNTSVKSKGGIALEAMTNATLKGANALVEGKIKAEVNGTQAKLNGKVMTEVAGAVVKLN